MSTSIELPLSRALDEVQSVVLERFSKYGEKNISNSPGGPLNGLRVRLHDKLARLNNAVDSGNTDFDDDSFRDCFIDVVGYGLIGLLVVDGDWPSGAEKSSIDLDAIIDDLNGFNEKPLEKLIDRGRKTHRWSELAESSASPHKLDGWELGTTFKADGSPITWRRTAGGWDSGVDSALRAVFGDLPSLRALVDFYDYTDGTITEPDNTLQKEAA